MKMDKLRLMAGGTSTAVDLPVIGAAASGPFVLKNVEGLGPPDVVVRMGQTVLERASYGGKSGTLRQVIATVGLQPNWDVGQTAEELRTILYGLMNPRYGQMVGVEVWADGVHQAYAEGHVSKMEPAIFSKDPAVIITIDCDFPYLVNPVLTVEQPPRVSYAGIQAFTIQNKGTAPSGFYAGFILRANVGTTLLLSDIDSRGQKFQVNGINWLNGDRFIIDTRPGNRGVYRGAGGGPPVSIINYMNAGVSEWIQLYNGPNTFLLNAAAFDWDPGYLFAHTETYWGV